jgi:nicotinate-nucleotide pyrophosphorylase (carboxylating)
MMLNITKGYVMSLNSRALEEYLAGFFKEDDLSRNFHYLNSLPSDTVSCQLKFKDDLVVSGLPFFFETFNYLTPGCIDYKEFMINEGRDVLKSDNFALHFELPFNLVLTAERIALNLLQKSSSIASYTKKYTDIANKKNIAILDTRKTTPGHRALEKYSVQIGGGKNHRFGQADCWMVKDNHKSFFGGVEKAIKFFKDMNSFYTPIIVEVHSLAEIDQAVAAGSSHLMLDNFSPEEVKEAVKSKKSGVTFEVSGGIDLNSLESYLIDGVDAISSGSLTYNSPHVDISLKYQKKL